MAMRTPSDELEGGPDKVVYLAGEDLVPAESFGVGDGLYARLQRGAARLRIEQRGIERVPEDARTDLSPANAGSMVRCSFLVAFSRPHGLRSFGWLILCCPALQWLSANLVVSSFAIGALATPLFQLGFIDTVLTIFFFNILGILPVCFFSTFGPRFGLRQMMLSRFYFGYYAVKISVSPRKYARR